MVLNHFNSIKEYKKFAKETLENVKRKRYKDSEVIKKTFVVGKDF